MRKQSRALVGGLRPAWRAFFAAIALTALGGATQLVLFLHTTQPHGDVLPEGRDLKVQRTFVSPFDEDWPNTVAICLLIKLEPAGDLREWLQYHRWDMSRPDIV